MDHATRQTRFELFQFILAHCRPPTIQELVQKTGYKEDAISQMLERLADLHHIRLYGRETPSPIRIAMAHPFSHLPTPYVVCQGSKSWWANCAWCAFGLAAMLSPAETVVSVLLRSGKHVAFKTFDGELKTPPENYCVTFSPPPSRWWDDVKFACSTIQICESREVAEAWFSQHGFDRGDVLDLQTVWKLSKAWYGDKHTYDYERKSPAEVKTLFDALGMTAPYWTT